jgi:two-component system chemotaxis response regulator CheB
VSSPVRVLVAEDSATTRELLVGLLGSDPAIEVVGTAAHGEAAVELTRRLRPSIVVMDIHMPVMDGFEATKRIMLEAPTPIVIVSSRVDPRDVEVSLHAVRVGALTVVAKPPAPTAPDFGERAGRLVALVKALSEVTVVRRRWFDDDRPAAPLRPGRTSRVRALAIAASTGGPAALYRLLERLPGDLPVPVLVVQHIADGFVPGLVSWLGTSTELSVKVAEEGERLRAGTVYVAPSERHLEVRRRGTAALSDADPVGGFRPAVDVLFASVAEGFGASALAVVLTGMGTDGVQGAGALRRAGARVLVQDRTTSVVYGMPGAVAAAGLANLVAPLDALPGEICRRLAEPT